MALLELGVQSPPSEIPDTKKKKVLSKETKTYKIPPSLWW